MSDIVLEQVKALAASLPAYERAELVEWLNGELESIAPEPPAKTPPAAERQPLTREEARRRLLAVGKLVTAPLAPEGAVALTDEKRARLAKLFSSGATLQTLIDEDRGARE